MDRTEREAVGAARGVLGDAASGGGGLRVRFRGVRGSIASPGLDTSHFGGNTPCLEVTAGDQRLILDAGTGIRALGEELMGASEPVRATLFLTHFHWDHVQGLPLFGPIHDERFDIQIVGPVQTEADVGEVSVRSLVERLFHPSHFPVVPSSIAASSTFGHLNEGTWQRRGVTVRAMRVRHPSFTVGYRVDVAGRSIAYVPDNEVFSDVFDLGADWWPRFVGFLSDVDVLVHDATFTAVEYASRRGHGHSSIPDAIDLADEVGAGELVLFHHAPTRGDEELDRVVARARNEMLVGGRSFGLRAAREGEEIRVGRMEPGTGEVSNGA